MSYETGRMGMAEGIGLVFMILLPRIFLTSPAQIIERTGGLAWLDILLNGVITLVSVLVMHYVLGQLKGDLYTAAGKLFGRWVANGIALLYIIIFFSNAVILFRQYSENTLITALPNTEFNLVVISFGFVAVLLIYMGIEGMARTAYLLLPFTLTALVVVILLLAPLYNIYNLAPWLGYGIGAAVKDGVMGAGINIGAQAVAILAVAFAGKRRWNTIALWGVGVSTVLKVVFFSIYIMVFGVELASEKTLPFFEMSRLVYLSRYLQRIEALFIVLWVIVGTLSIAISIYLGLYLMTRMLDLPTMRPLISSTAILLVNLCMLPPDIITVVNINTVFVRMLYNAGIYGIPFLLLSGLWIRKRRAAPFSR